MRLNTNKRTVTIEELIREAVPIRCYHIHRRDISNLTKVKMNKATKTIIHLLKDLIKVKNKDIRGKLETSLQK